MQQQSTIDGQRSENYLCCLIRIAQGAQFLQNSQQYGSRWFGEQRRSCRRHFFSRLRFQLQTRRRGQKPIKGIELLCQHAIEFLGLVIKYFAIFPSTIECLCIFNDKTAINFKRVDRLVVAFQ